MLRWRTLWAVAAAVALLPAASRAAEFTVTPLVVDDPAVLAPLGFSGSPITDPNLVNPWGVSFSPTSPVWVSDNGPSVAPGAAANATFSSLYTLNTGRATLVTQFSVPDTTGGGANLTGQVFNPNFGGKTPTFGGNIFLFASETGGIYGFKGGTISNLYAQNTNDVFKGLALVNVNGTPTLLATNFRQGTVDAFANTGFSAGPPATLSRTGQFNPTATDTTLPAGFAPFNIQQLSNGKTYVTFALQNGAKHDDVAGPGNGFVDVLTFDAKGNPTFTRLISGDKLNSPWGLAIAPAGFPQFAGDLLVGNFGDGTINAFDPNSGAFLGTIGGADGQPLDIPGLWALWFGSGGGSGPTGRLFFTAGVPGPNGNGIDPESDGLLGAIDPIPEPTSLGLFLVGGAGLWLLRRRKARPA